MSWVDGIVEVRDEKPPDRSVDVDLSIRLYVDSKSYDEYVLKCVCFGVEPIFSREDFRLERRVDHMKCL